jgi:hypothetical protein
MSMRKYIFVSLAALAGSACVTSDIRPAPKVQAVQAQQEIVAAELLDVGIRVFDPGLPAAPANAPLDTEQLAKKGIYPELRKAEARWIPAKLRATLESTSQWGAVRVIPDSVQFLDVIVTGRIVESNGMNLAIVIDARDSQGRVWIDGLRSEAVADLGSYKTDAALKMRDPFENAYAAVANALLAARDRLSATERREIRQVTDLRFAADITPDKASGYVAADAKGILRIARLPAADDPIMSRVAQVRERDLNVVDTLDAYYGGFYERLSEPYGQYRRVSFDEMDKVQQAKNAARTRIGLGAAVILASVLAPQACSADSYNCQIAENTARSIGIGSGVAAIYSGVKKYGDVKVHAEALSELARSFENESKGQVVEVEGRMLKLTGTTEEQYREWRKLLAEWYRSDSGGPPPAMQPPAPAPAPAAVPAAAPAAPAPLPPAGTAVATADPAATAPPKQ